MECLGSTFSGAGTAIAGCFVATGATVSGVGAPVLVGAAVGGCACLACTVFAYECCGGDELNDESAINTSTAKKRSVRASHRRRRRRTHKPLKTTTMDISKKKKKNTNLTTESPQSETDPARAVAVV